MRILISALVALSLLAAACGDDDEDATSDALSKVCEQQAQVLEDLDALAALEPATNTAGEYRSALDTLQSSVDDLRAARADLVEQDVANVENAFDSLKSELGSLDDVVLSELEGEVGSTIDAAADELQALYAAAYASSSCAPSDGEE